MQKGWAPIAGNPASLIILLALLVLRLTNPEHLGTAYRAHTLSRRLTILHGYFLGVFHFPLGPTFHAIGLHLFTSLFALKDIPFLR
jgi:hypothetical protein